MRRWYIWTILFAMWMCLFAPGARAGPLAGPSVATCLATVRTGDTPARMLVAGLARFDCRARQTAFGPGNFWVRSQALPDNIGTAWPASVRFASVWQDRVTLWAMFADGAVTRVSLDGHGVSRHLHLGAIVEVRLPDRHVAVSRLLWRVDGSANMRGVLIGTSIASPDQSARAELIMAAIYAGFAGLCLTLLIYNLALWAAMRHRFQLIYCGMLMSLLAYASSNSGLLAWLVPGIDNNDRLLFSYATLAVSACAALAFARSFFEPRIFEGWLGRATTAIVTALLCVTTLLVALAPVALPLLDRLYAASFVPLLAVVAPMLWRAWRRRSDYLWLFMVAWSAPVLMGGLRVAASVTLIRWNVWVDNTTILSMTLEALLSSLAIAYRIRQLSVERDEAREQEVAARLLADTDPLTGLLNRRAFLRHAIGRAGEQSLILADIDHFKAVNEALGHDGGDEVLRRIARALRAAAPPGALIARVGGEEFALLGPPPLPSEAVLARVRAERMPFDRRVTISLGICTGPLADEADWNGLYRRADKALFAAKASGRDRARDAGSLVRAA